MGTDINILVANPGIDARKSKESQAHPRTGEAESRPAEFPNAAASPCRRDHGAPKGMRDANARLRITLGEATQPLYASSLDLAQQN
jgi:hypothetical protein